jgi:hypothetical protein
MRAIFLCTVMFGGAQYRPCASRHGASLPLQALCNDSWQVPGVCHVSLCYITGRMAC